MIHKLTVSNIVIDMLLVAYIFLGVFLPPTPNASIRAVVTICSIAMVVACIAKNGNIAFNKKMLHVSIAFVPFLAYFILAQLAHMVIDPSNGDEYFRATRLLLLAVTYGLIVMIAFSAAIQVFGLSRKRCFRLFIAAAMLQLACVLLAFFVPEVKRLFINYIIDNSTSDVLVAAFKSDYSSRCFGFAGNLFDAFGYTTAILIVMTYIYGLQEGLLSIRLLAIAMLAMPFLNARTGILLSMAGFFIVFCFYFEVSKAVKYVSIVLLMVVFFTCALPMLPLYNSISNGVEATVGLLLGEAPKGVYAEILGNDLVLPPNLFFGMGASPEALGSYSGIDSGYIQCLWRFGILGTVLFVLAVLYAFVSIFKFDTNDKAVRCFSVFVLVSYFLYLFKMFSLVSFEAVFLIAGIMAVTLEGRKLCSAGDQL